MASKPKKRAIVTISDRAPIEKTKSFDEWLTQIQSACARDLEPNALGLDYGFKGGDAPSRAAKTIDIINKIREAHASGDLDLAFRRAVELGASLKHDELWAFYVDGLVKHQTGQKAAAAAWGSFSERLDKKNRLCALYEAERPKHGSDEAAYNAVAKREGVHWHTVRRAVTGY